MSISDEQKEIVLLSIIEAMGGQTDAGDERWSWLQWFCADEVGKEADTFNRCIDKGWLKSSHDSDTDHSVAWITDEGIAALRAAAKVRAIREGDGEVAQGSCASCNGTGDTGGNPSYGMCPDCDGTGKFPPTPAATGGEKKHSPDLIAALVNLRTKLEALPEPLRGPFVVKGLKPYLTPTDNLEAGAGDLVERLKPRHPADEPLARAVVSTNQAERLLAVEAYLAANNALKSEAAAQLAAVTAENVRLRELTDRLKLEAQCHAGEARGANHTIYEIYQAITGATGEPGNWHGAEPVREYVARSEAQLKAACGALTEALHFITNIDNAHKSVRLIRAALSQEAPK